MQHNTLNLLNPMKGNCCADYNTNNLLNKNNYIIKTDSKS